MLEFFIALYSITVMVAVILFLGHLSKLKKENITFTTIIQIIVDFIFLFVPLINLISIKRFWQNFN